MVQIFVSNQIFPEGFKVHQSAFLQKEFRIFQPSDRISEPATVKERDFVELAVSSLQRRMLDAVYINGMKHLVLELT